MSRADRRARKKANTRQAREDQYAGWRQARRRRWAAQVMVLLLVAALIGGAAAALFSGGDGDETATDTTSTTASTGPTTTTPLPAELASIECSEDPPEGAGEEKPKFDAPPEMQIDTGAKYRATIDTSCGDITVELDPAAAPQGVNSFVFLAGEGFYDGLTFHRVCIDFMIQGGDPLGNGTGDAGYSLPDELPDGAYQVGDVAYANSGPNTSGSQFFIVTGAGGQSLPPSYTRIGHVVEGLDVATRISYFQLPENAACRESPPSQPVHITKVTVEEA